MLTSVDCLRLVQLLLGRSLTPEDKSRMRRHLEAYGGAAAVRTLGRLAI